MATTTEKTPCQAAVTEADEWYNRLRDEVEYRCSFCDAIQTDINEMQEKVKAAYARTATSLRGIYDVGEIAKRWYGMLAFSTEVLEHARFLKDTNQICGVDLATLLEYQKEAFYRFRLHCPEFAEQCHKAASVA
jgi:hypothetical protein